MLYELRVIYVELSIPSVNGIINKAETRLYASKVSNLKIVLVNGERKLSKDNEKVSTLPLKETISPLAKPSKRLHVSIFVMWFIDSMTRLMISLIIFPRQ